MRRRLAGSVPAQRPFQARQEPPRSRRIHRSTGWMPRGPPTPRIERRTGCACERGDSSAGRGGRSPGSRARSLVRFATPAGGLHGYGHEDAAAARMKGRHRIGLGPDFACIEGLARGAWQARVLSRDPSSDPLTGEVRVHGGPAGEHIEPLHEQSEFTQPIRLRLGRVRRRHSVEALPPSWKDVRGGKGRLPAIEIRPREIRSGGCHRRPVDQPTFMACAGPQRRRPTLRSYAGSRSLPAHPAVRLRRRGRPAARLASDPADGLGLAAHIRQKLGIRRPLQAFLDQRSDHDLQAHRQLHGDRRPAGETSGTIDQVTGQDDENARFALEHSTVGLLEGYISYISHINHEMAAAGFWYARWRGRMVRDRRGAVMLISFVAGA